MRWLALGVLAAVMGTLTACNDTGGGGPGGGPFTFTQGYVFVRPDDRNVYLVNASDVQTVFALTTSGNDAQPSLSADGKEVVFVHGTGAASELDVVPTSGGTPSVLVPADASRSNLRDPVFSPDGATVAFAYDRGGASYLGAVGSSGQGLTELSSGSPSLSSPSFLPDGQTLLVAAGSSPGQLTQLETFALSTGNQTVVAADLGSEALGVSGRVVASPDGSQAVFDGMVGSGATRIFQVDLASGTVTRLSDHPGEASALDSFPTWVNASTVAFSSTAGGADQVYTLALPVSQANPGQLQLPSAIMPWFGPQS